MPAPCSAGFEVRYAYQQLDKPARRLHRAGGPREALGHCPCHPVAEEAIGDAPFAVINADDYYGPQGFKLMLRLPRAATPTGTAMRGAMVGFLLGNTVSANGSVSRGVCVTDESTATWSA